MVAHAASDTPGKPLKTSSMRERSWPEMIISKLDGSCAVFAHPKRRQRWRRRGGGMAVGWSGGPVWWGAQMWRCCRLGPWQMRATDLGQFVQAMHHMRGQVRPAPSMVAMRERAIQNVVPREGAGVRATSQTLRPPQRIAHL
jgi:hypothetical protein